jgi:hypothetical protein
MFPLKGSHETIMEMTCVGIPLGCQQNLKFHDCASIKTAMQISQHRNVLAPVHFHFRK